MRLVLALVVLLGLPASASASSASVVLADGCAGDAACQKYAGAPPVPVTTFEGGAGEANRVTVSRDGSELVLRDDGATLGAKEPCRSVDDHTARCPVTEGTGGVRGLALALGDGEDTAAIAGDPRVESTISAGLGDDTVTGGGGNDRIDGGPGDDRLAGGGGFDELSYTSRAAPLVVDLALGKGGEPGEADDLDGFETLLGGSGADVLRGSGADEVIDGGEGADAISGGGGDDALFGNVGADRLSGQDGDDRLFGDPAQGDDIYTPIIPLRADRLSGGRGDDVLSDTGGRNLYFGGPGKDVLEGGAGPDRMKGGSGNDRVLARGGGRDRVDCGAGPRDRARTDRRDTRRGCERGRAG